MAPQNSERKRATMENEENLKNTFEEWKKTPDLYGVEEVFKKTKKDIAKISEELLYFAETIFVQDTDTIDLTTINKFKAKVKELGEKRKEILKFQKYLDEYVVDTYGCSLFGLV